MPLDNLHSDWLEISVNEGVRYLKVVGPISNASLYDAFEALWASEHFDNTLPEVYDTTQMDLENSTVDGAGVQRFSELNRSLHADAPRVKVALLAPDPVVYGIGRQFLAYLGDRYSDDSVRLFKDKQQAEDWIRRET